MIKYSTTPLTEEEKEIVSDLCMSQVVLGRMHRGIAADLINSRIDRSVFTAEDWIKLFIMAAPEIEAEIMKCLQAAPCWCENPDCKHRQEQEAEAAAAVTPANPLDTPLPADESEFTEKLKSIWGLSDKPESR